MEKILTMLVNWIEYFKKKDSVIDERINNIEEYLESLDSSLESLVTRLEKLEEKPKEEVKEVIKDDTTINTGTNGNPKQ